MLKTEFLRNVIGKPLSAARICSYHFENKVVEKVNVLFLKFDNWYRVVSTDERTTFEYVEPNLATKSVIDSPFAWISNPAEDAFPEFNQIYTHQLVKTTELVLPEAHSMSFGIHFYFSNNQSLILHNLDYPEDRNELIFENQIPIGLLEINPFRD